MMKKIHIYISQRQRKTKYLEYGVDIAKELRQILLDIDSNIQGD